MEYLLLGFIGGVIGLVVLSLIRLWLKRKQEQREYEATQSALAEARKHNHMIGADRAIRIVEGSETTGNDAADIAIRKAYRLAKMK